MAKAKKFGTKRIKFGTSGVKDEFGNVLVTDHVKFGEMVNRMVDGSLTTKELRDKRIQDAIDGAVRNN